MLKLGRVHDRLRLTGTLVYELITGKQLFEVGNNLASYEAKIASFHLNDLSDCPPQLVPTLKAMLSKQPSARPNANAFAGAPYFQAGPICCVLAVSGWADPKAFANYFIFS